LETPPLLEDAMRRAEDRATEKLGRPCNLVVYTHLSDALLAKLEAIDHQKFRQELWYSHDDFIEKTMQRDFVCFVLSADGEPSAFLYGYDYADEPSAFFLDEVVTLVEGSGVGKILITLLLVYCYELGYRHVVLYTEDTDDKGRRLKRFYEHMGFTEARTDPELGLVMRIEVTEDSLMALYNRVMYSEGGPHPPYLR
jgi:ribosomal protein S18 acetylase RimI-like enzyme